MSEIPATDLLPTTCSAPSQLHSELFIHSLTHLFIQRILSVSNVGFLGSGAR